MYRLSSYVMGSMITALVLTPFVTGPDRSFVGSLLATSVAEPIASPVVSVNRALKGDRHATPSLLADYSAPSESFMPKSSGVINSAQEPFTAPQVSPVIPAVGETQTGKAPAAKNRMLDGCESAFSEITDRQLADIPGRCMAALPSDAVQLAGLN